MSTKLRRLTAAIAAATAILAGGCGATATKQAHGPDSSIPSVARALTGSVATTTSTTATKPTTSAAAAKPTTSSSHAAPATVLPATPNTTTVTSISYGPPSFPRPPAAPRPAPWSPPSVPPSPPASAPPSTAGWPPPGGGLPPGPPPVNQGPYGGYGLWLGTCQQTGGEFGYGQITTHWDQYRATAAVKYLEMVAAFSHTGTPATPVPGSTYTNVQNVDHPSWGSPILVGARHQDGPLYLEFRTTTPHSVISASFYWLDANHNVLWQSPSPLSWSC